MPGRTRSIARSPPSRKAGLRRAAACLSACAALVAGAAAARDEAELRACMAANLPQQSLAQEMTLTRFDDGVAAAPITARWYWRRHSSGSGFDAMMRLTAPPDLAGSAYLLLADSGRNAFFVYLPSVDRVRHVTGATAAQSLFASGISPFDLKLMTAGLRGGELIRQGDTVSDDRPAERWRYRPPPDPDILYDRIELVVDNAWCLPLSADLYGGVPWKTVHIDRDSVTRVDGRWMARRATIDNLRDHSRTRIEVGLPRVDARLPEALFSPRHFYRTQ